MRACPVCGPLGCLESNHVDKKGTPRCETLTMNRSQVEPFLRDVMKQMLSAGSLQASMLYPLIGTDRGDGMPIHIEITIKLLPSHETMEIERQHILKEAGVG